MPDNASDDGIKKKRIKVSFTCKECRIRRTKCDKKSPCQACNNRNSLCEYDAERQIKPRRPNKDSLILRLSSQVDYYKKICKQFVPNSEFRDFNTELINIDYALGSRTLKKHNTIVTNYKNNSNDIVIQYKCGTGPDALLSLNYCLKNDNGFNQIFLNSKENKHTNTNNCDLSSSVHYKKISNYQKVQFERFNKLIQSHHRLNDPSQKELVDKTFKFFHYDYHNADLEIVEDEVVGESSQLLKKLMEDLQKMLPSYTDMTYFIDVYMNNFHSEAPLVTFDDIKRFINENVVRGDNDECILKPLKTNIRNSLCYYAIIFIIFGISSESLKLKTFFRNDAAFSFRNDVDPSKLATVAMQLIKCSKVYLEPNITKLTGFLYVWLNFCYLPNANSYATINDGSPTRILTNILLVLCDNINLYALNHDNPNIGLTDDETETLRNYFMLRFSLITSIDDIYNQKCVSFKFDETQRQRLLQYCYKNNPLTNNAPISQNESNTYKLYLVKLVMMYHIQDCYSLLSKLSGTINLTHFENRLNFMLEYYNRELSLNYMKTPNSRSIIFETYTPNIKIDQHVAINKILFEISFIKSVSELKMYSFLITVLETNQIEKYWEYFFRLVNKIVDTVVMLNDFVVGNYQKYLGDLESLFMTKNCERLFDQLLFSTLQVLSRMMLNSVGLKGVIDTMFKVLMKALSLYTKKYRFIRYRSFQYCLFVEDILIKYTKGEFSLNESNKQEPIDVNTLHEILSQRKLLDIIQCDEFELDVDYMSSVKDSLNICELFTNEFMSG